MVGWSDVDVDLSDHAQLARLAAAVPQNATLVSSDLGRAMKTADAIQTQQTRLPHDANLREMNFGDWELKTFQDVTAHDPDRIRAFYETPGDIAPPNGESWAAFSNRVHHALDRQIAATQTDALVVVAHYGVVIAALERALNIPAYTAFSYPVHNLSLTEIHINATQWTLVRTNITF